MKAKPQLCQQKQRVTQAWALAWEVLASRWVEFRWVEPALVNQPPVDQP